MRAQADGTHGATARLHAGAVNHWAVAESEKAPPARGAVAAGVTVAQLTDQYADLVA